MNTFSGKMCTNQFFMNFHKFPQIPGSFGDILIKLHQKNHQKKQMMTKLKLTKTKISLPINVQYGEELTKKNLNLIKQKMSKYLKKPLK